MNPLHQKLAELLDIIEGRVETIKDQVIETQEAACEATRKASEAEDYACDARSRADDADDYCINAKQELEALEEEVSELSATFKELIPDISEGGSTELDRDAAKWRNKVEALIQQGLTVDGIARELSISALLVSHIQHSKAA